MSALVYFSIIFRHRERKRAGTGACPYILILCSNVYRSSRMGKVTEVISSQCRWRWMAKAVSLCSILW